MDAVVYDLHRLRLLRELSHRGSLAAVAGALGYNPSSVSHQLGVLEREVGVPLLERAGRGVRLTPAAVVLVDHTEMVLRHLEQAAADVAALQRDIAGTVRLATFQTAAHAIIPTALLALRDEHPAVNVRVTHIDAEQALPMLLARDFDLVLQEEYPGDPAALYPGVSRNAILEDELLLVVPPGTPPTLDAASQLPWVLEREGTMARRWAMGVCRRTGQEPTIGVETSDISLHLRMIENGLAAGLIPRLYLQSAATTAAASALPGRPARTISLARRTGSDSNPTIAAVHRAIIQAVPHPEQ